MELNLIDCLSQLDDQQRLRFYEALAHSLTVVNRSIWTDENARCEVKVERLKKVNEILHRVVLAIPIVRAAPKEWSDELMVGEIRRWIAEDKAIGGDVNWAIQTSLELALASEWQGRAAPDQLGA